MCHVLELYNCFQDFKVGSLESRELKEHRETAVSGTIL